MKCPMLSPQQFQKDRNNYEPATYTTSTDTRSDKSQQPPLETVNRTVRQVPSILHDNSLTGIMFVTGNHPKTFSTKCKTAAFCVAKMFPEDEDIITAVSDNPSATVLTFYRRAAATVNNALTKHMFQGQNPIAELPCDLRRRTISSIQRT
ncbi:hypothetical protein OS493_039556 [Desmophyllum pertusum]|uniref:Uncharacterized protein n=1 Tax=Desmophyllum pertusum TaxID=174260 RepID=A0A9X0CQ33_9CNID|nr:hypothetical protein OS493_039556 [Desmophyllum pertusum]